MALLLPPLSSLQATLLGAYFACSYVGSLYISKNTRLSFFKTSVNAPNGSERQRQDNERWRNDPDVIRARLLAVLLATLSSCIVCYGTISNLFKTGGNVEMVYKTLRYLGFTAPHPALSHLVTPILFFGPLYAMYLYRDLPFQSHWTWDSFSSKYVNIIGLRNLIVAPLTEEVAFRACMLSMYYLCGASAVKMIFLSPLWFGLAHVHHGWEIYNRFGRNQYALKRAVFTVLFQLAYTTLFGFHCCYLFLRTGSVLPPLTAHIFCNVMGFPTPAAEMNHFPQKKNAIALAYFAGIVGYVYAMRAWTRTGNSIYWMSTDQKAVVGY